VMAELDPEVDGPLVRHLEATAALLSRRLEGAGRQGAEAARADVSAGDVPAAYALEAAYPNPFTGATSVPFSLPEAARVTVHVYDLLGRRVAVLVEGVYAAGRHVAVLDGGRLASGVYVVRAVMEREPGGK